MTLWYRQLPFGSDHGHEWTEQWEYRPVEKATRSFEVRVRVGKSFDVLALKGIDLDEVRKYSDFLNNTAKQLYREESSACHLEACPICYASLKDADVELFVFGVRYLRCCLCGHVCVDARPAREVMDGVFSESEAHSGTYIDRDAIELRMEQIVSPKLDWCMNVFQHSAGRAARTLIDVGAGGGHFLAGAARQGMVVEGFEMSRASRVFARDVFNLNLRQDNFLASSPGPTDLITFWGLLEYVAQPREFIAAARKALVPEGMLIVEVPRVDSLGTLVQAMDGAVVARHMDPTTHVNGFSDASLCTALVEEGFAPVAVWYFGMDAYETCIQMALKAGTAGLFETFSGFIPVIQQALDRGRQCDDIIVAAVPLERT
jgi:2-polyprenyl-3-methyl-5-hydroxy-6-metoxy-1,4-benzoquinol methylase